jgi:hypothetical protein
MYALSHYPANLHAKVHRCNTIDAELYRNQSIYIDNLSHDSCKKIIKLLNEYISLRHEIIGTGVDINEMNRILNFIHRDNKFDIIYHYEYYYETFRKYYLNATTLNKKELIPITNFNNNIEIITNPLCKSLNSEEINKIILDIFKFYNFYIPYNLLKVIFINNKTNLELFYTYYSKFFEITDFENENNNKSAEHFLMIMSYYIEINHERLANYEFRYEHNYRKYKFVSSNKLIKDDKLKNQYYEIEIFEKLLNMYILKNPKCSSLFYTELIRFGFVENIFEIYYNNKIVPPYNFLVIALAHGHIDIAKRICMSGANIIDSTLDTILTYLEDIKTNNFESEQYNIYITNFYNVIDFLFENNFKKFDKKIIFRILNNICVNPYHTKLDVMNIVNKFASLLFSTPGSLTIAEFTLLTRYNIKLNNVEKLKFNLTSPELCDIYDELNS